MFALARGSRPNTHLAEGQGWAGREHKRRGITPSGSAPCRTPARTNQPNKTKGRTSPRAQCLTIFSCYYYQSLVPPATCPRPSFLGFNLSLYRLTKEHRAWVAAAAVTAWAASTAASAAAADTAASAASSACTAGAAASAATSACAAGAAAAALPPSLLALVARVAPVYTAAK